MQKREARAERRQQGGGRNAENAGAVRGLATINEAIATAAPVAMAAPFAMAAGALACRRPANYVDNKC